MTVSTVYSRHEYLFEMVIQDLSYCYLHMSNEKVASFDFHDKIRFEIEEETDGMGFKRP